MIQRIRTFWCWCSRFTRMFIISIKTQNTEESVDLAQLILLKINLMLLPKNITINYLQKYNVSEDQLKKAIHEIEKLNPKPGGSFTGNQ